jgi:N-acetylneuraminic acid mutarotase
MVYARGQIYIISGFTQGSQLTTSVERFDPQTGKTMKLSDCLQASNSPTCCTFANKYIYKFGGNNNDGSLVQIVERYDIDSNRWEQIDPKLDEADLDNFE